MHNPLALLSKDLLDGMIQQGNLYFVRQAYPRGIDHFETGIKRVFLFTHYTDKEQAAKHHNVLFEDTAGIYDASVPEDFAKLYTAASQPAGYKIYAALLKEKIWTPTPQLGPKIKQYIRVETRWKPGKGDHVTAGLFIQFGELFIHLRSGRDELKVKLSDIEKY